MAVTAVAAPRNVEEGAMEKRAAEPEHLSHVLVSKPWSTCPRRVPLLPGESAILQGFRKSMNQLRCRIEEHMDAMRGPETYYLSTSKCPCP
ncbi:unnamed protein product [Urochloa humidicola]